MLAPNPEKESLGKISCFSPIPNAEKLIDRKAAYPEEKKESSLLSLHFEAKSCSCVGNFNRFCPSISFQKFNKIFDDSFPSSSSHSSIQTPGRRRRILFSA